MAEKKEVMEEVVDVEALKAELESVKAELEQVKETNKQYEEAYKAQGERYNRLFDLFANNLDFYIMGKKKN